MEAEFALSLGLVAITIELAAEEADFQRFDLTCWPRSEAVLEQQFEAVFVRHHLEADFGVDLQLEAAYLDFGCHLLEAFFEVHDQTDDFVQVHDPEVRVHDDEVHDEEV